MKQFAFLSMMSIVILFSSCKKDDPAPAGPVLQPKKGIYVLSEGSFGGNNTRLGYYTLSGNSFSPDFFLQQNPGAAGLGDIGNDMVLYGGKLYIVMNVTSQVTVLNAATGALIRRIDFRNGTADKLPRYATAARGKVFVTSYDNTVSVVDTSSLAIVQSIATGANPDGIAAYGDYLYVANSGSFNFPDVDSTVSVINLNTMTEVKKITVGLNPNKVEVAANGDVYVTCYGNFSSVPASVAVINSSDNTLKAQLGAGFSYSHVRMNGDLAYFYNNYGGSGVAKVYNTRTGTVVRNEFVTDGTSIDTPYGINIDEESGEVFVCDAKDFVTAGTVYCFNADGTLQYSFSTAPGINPNKVVFNR